MRLKTSFKSISIVLVVAVFTALALATFVIYSIQSDLARVRAFKETYSAEKVVGKSKDEIMRLYGQPRFVLRDEYGRVQIVVYNEDWHYCNIHLRDDVAESVSFEGK